jgi:hypothetical protein
MKYLCGGVLAALLLSSLATPAFAQCVNSKCTDTTTIDKARTTIENTCNCTKADQKPGKYKTCAKKLLKGADLTAQITSKACRNLILKCETSSLCGRVSSAVCCVQKKNGKVKASIVKTAAKCKKGSACGAMLGFVSTFDACATDGTCAGPPATTTTTTLPSGGMVLKGALPATLGRFNFAGGIGLPGALNQCHTSFGAGTHVCTYAELQSAQTAGDLVGLKDTTNAAVTAFWAIDSSQPALSQCNDDAPGTGSGLNWEYGTAHTSSRAEKVALNPDGTLGPLQSGMNVFCSIGGTAAWVGCCQ